MPREQRRLAGVGQPDEPDVGEQLEVQLDRALLARQPALGQPRRLARRRLGSACCRARRRRRAATVTSWPGRDEVVARPVPARRPACRAARAITSGSPSAPWRWAPWPCPPRSARKCARRRNACRSRRLSSQRSTHVAAAAAVAAVRPALGHVRLAPERQAAVAARAGADLDAGAVVEHDVAEANG